VGGKLHGGWTGTEQSKVIVGARGVLLNQAAQGGLKKRDGKEGAQYNCRGENGTMASSGDFEDVGAKKGKSENTL